MTALATNPGSTRVKATRLVHPSPVSPQPPEPPQKTQLTDGELLALSYNISDALLNCARDDDGAHGAEIVRLAFELGQNIANPKSRATFLTSLSNGIMAAMGLDRIMHNAGKFNVQAVFTTGEAAAVVRVSQQTIIRNIDKDILGGYKIPGTRDRLVARDKLLEYMKNYRIPTDLIEGPQGPDAPADRNVITPFGGAIAQVMKETGLDKMISSAKVSTSNRVNLISALREHVKSR